MQNLIFVLLILFSCLSSNASELILKKDLMIEHVAKQESSKIKDINIFEDKVHGLIFVYSSVNCGFGTCAQYVFKPNKGFFKSFGVIQGQIKKVEAVKNKMPVITTVIQMGRGNAETAIWVVSEKSGLYEVTN